MGKSSKSGEVEMPTWLVLAWRGVVRWTSENIENIEEESLEMQAA